MSSKQYEPFCTYAGDDASGATPWPRGGAVYTRSNFLPTLSLQERVAVVGPRRRGDLCEHAATGEPAGRRDGRVALSLGEI